MVVVLVVKHSVRLDWRPWVDMAGVSSVCIVCDGWNLHYDPTTETMSRIDGSLEDRYDIVYIDRPLSYSETFAVIMELYGPYLKEAGTLVFKYTDFGTSSGSSATGRRPIKRLSNWLCLPMSILKAARRLPQQRTASLARYICAFPRGGTVLMSDDLPLLLTHVRNESKCSLKVTCCLAFLLRAGLARHCSWLWPYRYVIVSMG